MKFKLSLIALSLISTFSLTGCDWNDSDSNSDTDSQTLTAIDGYLAYAEVYVDSNEDGIADDDELIGTTDENGEITITGDDLNYPVIIRTVEGVTEDNGEVITDAYELTAEAGSEVATPFTTLAILNDMTLAELADELGYDEEVISGDYLEAQDSTETQEDAEQAALLAATIASVLDESVSGNNTTELKATTEAVQDIIEELAEDGVDLDAVEITAAATGATEDTSGAESSTATATVTITDADAGTTEEITVETTVEVADDGTETTATTETVETTDNDGTTTTEETTTTEVVTVADDGTETTAVTETVETTVTDSSGAAVSTSSETIETTKVTTTDGNETTATTTTDDDGNTVTEITVTDSEGDEVEFTAELLDEQTWYSENFTALAFDASAATFTYSSLVTDEEGESGSGSYTIEDGSLVIAGDDEDDTLTISIAGLSDSAYTLQFIEGDESWSELFYTSLGALEATLDDIADAEVTATDDSDDSTDTQQRDGFELTSLSAQVSDGDLIITLNAAGDIEDALSGDSDFSACTDIGISDCSSLIWVTVNESYEFGIHYDEFGDSVSTWFTDAESVGEDEDSASIDESYYSYTLSDSTLTLTIDTEALPDRDYITIEAEAAYDGNVVNDSSEDEESYDEVSFDTVELNAIWSTSSDSTDDSSDDSSDSSSDDSSDSSSDDSSADDSDDSSDSSSDDSSDDGADDTSSDSSDSSGDDDADSSTSSIVGTWSNTEISFTFTDTIYTLTNSEGTESGTYTFDESTGAFTVGSMLSNADGDSGFFNEDDVDATEDATMFFTMAAAGNYATFSYDDDGETEGYSDSGSFYLYKSQDTTAAEYIAANYNFFSPSIELDDEEIEIEYDDMEWDSSDYSLSDIQYYYDFDTESFIEDTDDESDYVLTSDGWQLEDNSDAALTPQDDGSMVYSSSYQEFTLTGKEWSLAGSSISEFQDTVGIDEDLLDYFDEDATFSDDASLFVTTEEYSSYSYSVWLEGCDDDSESVQVADTGLCNTTNTTSDGSAVESISDITASTTFAEESDQSLDNFNGLYLNGYAIRLVNNASQSVDVYEMDWDNDSMALVSEDVTWSEITANGETLYTFSTEEDDLSDFNELLLTVIADEYGDGYLRQGEVRGSETSTGVLFNVSATDDIFDAFIDNIPVSTLEATVEDEVAVLTSVFTDYDGESDTDNKLYAVGIDDDDAMQISTDIKLENVSAPTDGNARAYIKLSFVNEDTGDNDETYDYTAYLQVRVYEDGTVIRPFISICKDSECDDEEVLKPDESDATNTMTYGMAIDTPTDFVNMGIELDTDDMTFIFTYDSYTASIAVSDVFDSATLSSTSYGTDDYDPAGASIRTKFSDEGEGESFSVTAYLDNVYINNALYDDFSSGSFDSDLWWSSAND